jgi:hypothetical protein
MLATNWVPWAAGGFALLAVGLALLVIVPPWRRVRDVPPLDDEIQARVLLGEDPEEIEAHLEGEDGDGDDQAAPITELHPEE